MFVKLRLFILLLFSSLYLTISAQELKVRGVVKDSETGENIIGANILIANVKVGAISDINGNFSINIKSKTASLIVSYVGYKTQTIEINGESNVTVLLKQNSQSMDEVVVVGYGVQKKESVIGAISAINNKSLISVPVSNLSQNLAGKISGVQIVQPSGEVGRDEAQIFVRGMGTYGDASPLIVIDGVMRSSFSQIDPNEVESINVLKDASATSVYGIKGANGVIVVTTRRGAEGKSKITATAQFAVTQPTRIPYRLGSYETAVLKNQHYVARMLQPENTALDIATYRTEASPYSHPDVNWMDEVVKDFSSLQQYNVNISGGTTKLKYFVSGGFMTQGSNYNNDPYTKFDRFNFRTNLDINVIKNLSISLNVGSRVEQRTNDGNAWQSSSGIYGRALSLSGRKYPMYNPDGSYTPGNLMGVIKEQGVYKQIRSVIETGLNLNYNLNSLVKGLSLRAQIAYDSEGDNQRLWQANNGEYIYNLSTNSYTESKEARPLSFSWGDGLLTQRIYGELGLQYSRKFNKHTVGGLLLANRSFKMVTTDFDYADQGVVSRLTYDYDNVYYAESSLCINGSENFPSNKRYGVFPSFALGYRLSNEEFFKNSALSKVITNLKIRGSLGWVGNDKLQIGGVNQRFLYLQQYLTGSGAVFGTGDVAYGGIYKDKIANQNVTWEVAKKENIGIETSFWGQLFGLNIDLFYENRTNILTDISSLIPQYVGATFMPANVGEVENKGIEIELNHSYAINKKFSYFIKSNFSFTRNKVIKRSDPYGLLPYQKQQGYAIGTPLMLNTLGVFQSYEDIYSSPTQLTIPGNLVIAPGDLKYEDINHDGRIDQSDVMRMGFGTTPEIQYGITVGAAYKNFDFSALFQGSANASFLKTWEVQWHFSNSDNVFNKHWYYWSPELGDANAQYVRLYGKSQNNEPAAGGSASYAYGNGNYVRLKNLEIGYNVPKNLIKNVGLTSARVYFTSNNLFTWSEEKYLDPDNRDSRGWKMPQMRAFNLGININF